MKKKVWTNVWKLRIYTTVDLKHSLRNGDLNGDQKIDGENNILDIVGKETGKERIKNDKF